MFINGPIESISMDHRTRRISKDNSGGIEGLPLQLMIMILVATMGTAIIIGWMGSIETPHAIGDVDVDPEKVDSVGEEFGFTVYVEDQDGNPLEGATVIINNTNVTDGSGKTPIEITGSDGEATFSGLTMSRHGTVEFIDITVSKPGYGERDGIKVVVRF